jgi:hypothetical protein
MLEQKPALALAPRQRQLPHEAGVKEGLHVSVFAGILAVNKLRPRY